jgi:hypothetical protein
MRSHRSTPVDGYPTDTSASQAATENILQSHWARQVSGDPNHVVTLKKESHVQFLLRNLVQGFPPRYTSQDASQPWLIFWTLQGFSVLGVGLDEQTKRRYAGTIQNLAVTYHVQRNRHASCHATSFRWFCWRTWPTPPFTSNLCRRMCACNCREQRRKRRMGTN